jgi:hypothetical protein
MSIGTILLIVLIIILLERAPPSRPRCREGYGDVLGALPPPPGATRSKLVGSVQFDTDSDC